MRVLIQLITDTFLEYLGQPVRLNRLLKHRPQVIASLMVDSTCIALNSVACWHELGMYADTTWPKRTQGFLRGWKWSSVYGYSSFELHRSEYAQIARCVISRNWSCEIIEVDGFSNSKSDLKAFTSTDRMVETNSKNYISEITQAKLTENLAHKEIRTIHAPGTDYFSRHSWDCRLFLCNDGGSHHLAAAKYIAARLPQSVTLIGDLHEYSLNEAAISSLCRDYEIFVVSDAEYIFPDFFKAMESFRATWLWHPMPKPFEEIRAVLLPKSERRSMRVAETLRRAGSVDLGKRLSELAAMQCVNV